MITSKVFLLSVGIFAVGFIFSSIFQASLAFMDSPKFCGSCHIMNEVVDSHENSAHAKLSCNECHMTHGLSTPGKVVFKAQAGSKHVYYNTIAREDIPDNLHISDKQAKVVQKNCIRCHSKTIENVSHKAKEMCVECHRDVPHGMQH